MLAPVLGSGGRAGSNEVGSALGNSDGSRGGNNGWVMISRLPVRGRTT